MKPILEVSDLTKRFGDLIAVDHISFIINSGEVLGLFGPNGAGKTTLLNLMTGLIKPDSGSVKYLGEELIGLKPHEVVAKGIARTFQLARPFKKMNVFENVAAALTTRQSSLPISVEESADEIIEFCGLSERRDQVANTLSQGELRRLELAKALATGPHLILLDELFSGLSLRDEYDLVSILKELNEKGITLLLISHSVRVLAELSGRVLVMSEGRKVAEGPPVETVPDVLSSRLI